MIVLYADETNEIEIQGTGPEFQELSQKLLMDGATIQCQQISEVAPYTQCLELIEINISIETPVKFEVIPNIALRISGVIENLTILSETMVDFSQNYSSGEHLHIEYYEDHFYLSPDSIPIVLVLSD